MTQGNLVSIIVPVYNAENSLHNCMNSILNQSYKQLEVIMINDGSTDNSGEICDSYAEADNRVKVIHQKNSGPSHARNTGINTAVGAYIQFVDADDYIEPYTTEILVGAITHHAQLVICGYQSIYMNGDISTIKRYIPSISGIYENTDFMQYFGELYKDILIPSPCNKLYNTNLINVKNIRFIEKIHYGEDLLFNLAYLDVCSGVHVIQDQLYNYLITSNDSLSRGFNEYLLENQQMLYKKVQDFLLGKGFYSGNNEYFMKIIYANGILNALNNLFHINSTYNPSHKKRLIAEIISDDHVRKNTNYFKNSLQAQIIGQLIKYNLKNGVYYFFSIKSILQNKLQPFFHLLKGKYGR